MYICVCIYVYVHMCFLCKLCKLTNLFIFYNSFQANNIPFSHPLETSENQSVSDNFIGFAAGRRNIVLRWVQGIKISITGVM